MATHECTWYNLDMLRKGFSAGTLKGVEGVIGDIWGLGIRV